MRRPSAQRRCSRGRYAGFGLGANMPCKLTTGDKHLLTLIAREAGSDAEWVVTSSQVYMMLKLVPSALIELVQTETGGSVRLTEEGRCVVRAMAWL